MKEADRDLKKCLYCNQPFEYKRRSKKYCSDSHRIKEFYRRRKSNGYISEKYVDKTLFLELVEALKKSEEKIAELQK